MKYAFSDTQQEVLVTEELPDRSLWAAIGPSLEDISRVVFSTENEALDLARETAFALAAALLAAAGCTELLDGTALWSRVTGCGFVTSKPLAAPVEAPQDAVADIAAEAHLRMCQKRRQERALGTGLKLVAVAS